MRGKRDIGESGGVVRGVVDEDGRGPGLAAVLALSTVAVIGTAVLYNAVFAQQGGPRRMAAAGIEAPANATTRIVVDAAKDDRTTVRLKYDPVVEAVQRELLAAGYYKGLVDGVAGHRTRRAIETYQKATGLAVDGTPSAELSEHIRFAREVAEASLFTGSTGPDAGAAEKARIRRVQTGLAELAYEPGQIDGELTLQTRDAIKRFEHDRGLPETGAINAALLSELEKLSGQSEIVAEQ
ncbi:MAG: peptidoglycan-binding protein [Hyphomicrobiales bacterium]